MSVSDLKRKFLVDNTGLSVGTIADLEYVYYSNLSGLSPKQFYSIADHKRAYFEAQTGLSGQTLSYLERAYWTLQGISLGSSSDMANNFYIFKTTAVTNLSLNPNALTGLGGWSSNDTINMPVTFVTTGVPIHPKGITTALKGHELTSNSLKFALNIYDMDVLGNYAGLRYLGLWIYSEQTGYEVTAFDSAPLPQTTLPVATWTFVKTSVAFTGYSGLGISKIVGNSLNTDNVYVTGCIASTTPIP